MIIYTTIQRSNGRKLPKDVDRIPILNPLLPLLPSVQIALLPFCELRLCGQILTPGTPKERCADNEHEEGKKLASGERTGQRGVGLSEEFADDSHDRIKKEEAS